MDPLFLFLVGDYRTFPTVAKAVAIYDIFCAPNALGRVSAAKALPVYDMRLAETIRPLRLNFEQVQASRINAEGTRTPALLPAKYLFDSVARELENSSTSLPRIRRQYQRHLTPMENLPGGKMTEAQRYFVEKVWQPVMRPRLVGAGFWRIATIA